jgi:hypothetical protein
MLFQGLNFNAGFFFQRRLKFKRFQNLFFTFLLLRGATTLGIKTPSIMTVGISEGIEAKMCEEMEEYGENLFDLFSFNVRLG